MEENAVFEKYLLPRLDSYKEFLGKNGVRAEMSIDADEVPGLVVFTGESESFYITFMEGDLEAPEVLRITAEHVDPGVAAGVDKAASKAGLETDAGSVNEGSEDGAETKSAAEDADDSVIKFSSEDIVYRSLLVAASDVEDVDTLMRFGKIALSERCMEPYPTKEMVEEVVFDEEELSEDETVSEDYALLEEGEDSEAADSEVSEDVASSNSDGLKDVEFAENLESGEADGKVSADEASADTARDVTLTESLESEDTGGKADADDTDLGEFSYNASAVLMPRISSLMRSYVACGVEDAEAVYAKVPYIILVDDDATFISAFEEIGDNEYLLHFRADVPFDEDEDIEELKAQIKAFNEEHLFVRCGLGFEDLGIYDDESENVITFFACTPDVGGIKDDDFYGFFAGLFESEYMEFFE